MKNEYLPFIHTLSLVGGAPVLSPLFTHRAPPYSLSVGKRTLLRIIRESGKPASEFDSSSWIFAVFWGEMPEKPDLIMSNFYGKRELWIIPKVFSVGECCQILSKEKKEPVISIQIPTSKLFRLVFAYLKSAVCICNYIPKFCVHVVFTPQIIRMMEKIRHNPSTTSFITNWRLWDYDHLLWSILDFYDDAGTCFELNL